MESNDTSEAVVDPMDTSTSINPSTDPSNDSVMNSSHSHGSNNNSSNDTPTGSQAMLANYKYIENYNFPHLDDSRKYEKVKKIGHGTFGEVFKAREKRSNKKFVAMKKVLIDNKEKEEGVRIYLTIFLAIITCYDEIRNLYDVDPVRFLCSQFPITALREIRILQLLKHENVVNLIEICYTKASEHNRYRPTFYLVFDFCEHDLAGLLANINVKFSLGEIKKVMQQLLNGLYYIHFNKVSILRQFGPVGTVECE